MKNKEEIFSNVKIMIIELFDVEESEISMDSQLYEELGLDSIDAVDMVLRLQNMTGKKIQPNDFKDARRISDVVGIVEKLLAP